jgi:hypothetical protein
MEDDDDIVEVAEAFGGEEVPPHLRALADAAQSGDAAALLAALGTSLIRLSPSRSSLVGKLVGYGVLRDLDLVFAVVEVYFQIFFNAFCHLLNKKSLPFIK